jgi:phosphoglycolate phosphatase-like HAD superfamily hydrolase
MSDITKVILNSNVLFNSNPWIMRTFDTVFTELHQKYPEEVRTLTKAEMESCCGPSLDSNIGRFIAPEHASIRQEAHNRYRALYDTEEGLRETSPHPGVKEALEALKAKGKSIYVVTEKAARAANASIEYHGFQHVIDGVYGTVLNGTPETEAELLKRLETEKGITPKNAVFVAGRPKSAASASKEYMVVGALWTGATIADFREAGARAAVGMPHLLAHVIETIAPTRPSFQPQSSGCEFRR